MKPTLAFLAVALCAAATAFASDYPAGFRGDLLHQIDFAQKQIMDLENAIPDKKMTWRPKKDVRSVGEVYMHIAFGNYLLPKFAGIDPPEALKLATPADATKWEKSTTDKKKIAEHLSASFDHLRDGIRKLSDADLEKEVTFFGQETNVRGMLLTALSHMHEHLGQSIAYARMNDIVPPWTAARQASGQSGN